MEPKTIRECADSLIKLGITGISEDIIKRVEYDFAEVPEFAVDSLNKITLILSRIGDGRYDYNTGVWKSTSSQVYSFDVEVFDIDNMYTLFLQGISSINNNEFVIANINESIVDFDDKNGTRKKIIKFCYNDNEYRFETILKGDWFNLEIIAYMNNILEVEDNPKKLFYMDDGYQECIVFYCTEAWAENFNFSTGCKLHI